MSISSAKTCPGSTRVAKGTFLTSTSLAFGNGASPFNRQSTPGERSEAYTGILASMYVPLPACSQSTLKRYTGEDWSFVTWNRILSDAPGGATSTCSITEAVDSCAMAISLLISEPSRLEHGVICACRYATFDSVVVVLLDD